MVRLVAAAKGLAVGVPTVCISVAGELVYLKSSSRYCIGTGLDPEFDCNAGLTFLGRFEDVVVLFALLLALGPLLAWGFLLPLPGLYVIPPFLTTFVDIWMRHAGLPLEFLLVAPFAGYPVIAVLSAGRRRKAPAPSPSSGRPKV